MNEKIIFLLRSVAECLEICVADELEEEKTKKYLNKKTTNRYDTYASLVIQCTCHIHFFAVVLPHEYIEKLPKTPSYMFYGFV